MYRKVTVSFPFVEQTLVKIVQIVCSQRYGEIGYVLSDNLGDFANQPNVNICLQKKTRFAPLPDMKVNQCKYSSRFRNLIEALR